MDNVLSFELYKLFRGEYYDSFKLHRDTLQHYLTFAAAVLGATIAGMLQIKGMGWIGMVILAGPILNISNCALAINMCDRFYLGVLERIVLLTKIESALGFQDSIELKKEGQGKHNPPFPEDKYFLSERWVTGTQYPTSQEFVQNYMNKGVNRVAKRSFYLLILVNAFLILAIIVIAFK